MANRVAPLPPRTSGAGEDPLPKLPPKLGPLMPLAPIGPPQADTREAANISGLASPLQGRTSIPGGAAPLPTPPAMTAAAAATPLPPISATPPPPAQHLPAEEPWQAVHAPAAPPPSAAVPPVTIAPTVAPLPPVAPPAAAPLPPPAAPPAAYPAPVAPGPAAAAAGGAPPPPVQQPKVPAGSAGGRPAPPQAPPPPSNLSDVNDERPLEEYIPFGFLELRNKLIVDHPDIFKDEATEKKFAELCKWMSLRNQLRLQLDYGDADEKYASLDPDKDTLALKPTSAAAGAGGKGAPPKRKNLDEAGFADVKARVAMFGDEMTNILDKAEFDELPAEDLDKAKNDKSLMGLNVHSASDEYLEFKVYYRGTRLKKIEWLKWGIFKRQITMNVYERLAISFRLKKPVSEDDAPEEPTYGVDSRPWYKKIFCCGKRGVGAGAPESLKSLRDEFLYMKLFKDVLQCDVDMLLPGSRIKFTWFDYLMIWAPIIFGFGFAVYKTAKGTIDFTNLVNAAMSIFLIVMPLTWGVRAWLAIKEKAQKYQAHLNALFIVHNLNNNSGVISQMLNEAQEQEDNEAMLAYFFLWLGSQAPQPVRKTELDRKVEAFLQAKLDEAGCAVRMDFEVTDSIGKLERLGLLHTVAAEGGEKMLQVVPLEQAVEKAHVKYFDESKETGPAAASKPRAKSKRQGALEMAWHECADVFRPTGQRFRYWWNAETGESTYYEPAEPYVKLERAIQAVDIYEADGENMREANKHKFGHAKTV
ncbi:hypothetical protein CHLRE_10g421950v5 [Chlamydomonas reinhardtii]|uniref:WW domain-containing protein n=1 Tax=Chlamydomonas reinhardtii TaxID=3055 RepID=A0A2K3D995_CHLRE|nr:uncharacterized protein CHLRE_10g421950v5 [Chlamydomonas reinhardtii]XP_042919886.1 uncharacterized protein CHLRE_10g421950v5 [Chlamydomonas reinhardtii]PNW77096.1 hypothetical protein CHLRE_10g421950v5 [Chlamydomonas reinhardtii]PNW77097.1 hypothetical protein CHLRE_10g421950v5 [Chlamydomonas reinhardtii]